MALNKKKIDKSTDVQVHATIWGTLQMEKLAGAGAEEC